MRILTDVDLRQRGADLGSLQPSGYQSYGRCSQAAIRATSALPRFFSLNWTWSSPAVSVYVFWLFMLPVESTVKEFSAAGKEVARVRKVSGSIPEF